MDVGLTLCLWGLIPPSQLAAWAEMLVRLALVLVCSRFLAWPGLARASRLGHAADCATQLPLLSTSVVPGQPPDPHHHHPLPGLASGVSLVVASTRLAVDLFLQPEPEPERYFAK